MLIEGGLLMSKGTLVDATLIAAPIQNKGCRRGGTRMPWRDRVGGGARAREGRRHPPAEKQQQCLVPEIDCDVLG